MPDPRRRATRETSTPTDGDVSASTPKFKLKDLLRKLSAGQKLPAILRDHRSKEVSRNQREPHADIELERDFFTRRLTVSTLDTLSQRSGSARSSTRDTPSPAQGSFSTELSSAQDEDGEHKTKQWLPPADETFLSTKFDLATPSFIQRTGTNRRIAPSPGIATNSSVMVPPITANGICFTASPTVSLPCLLLYYYNQLYFLPSPHDATFADVQRLLRLSGDTSLFFTVVAVTEQDIARWTRKPGFGPGGETAYPPLCVCGEKSWKESLSVITGWLRKMKGLERVGINVR